MEQFGARAEGQARNRHAGTPASDYRVCGVNQHPSKYVCSSLSAFQRGLSITPGVHPDGGDSLYPTTQDSGRRHPVATTAPSINILNHHPLYRNPPRYLVPLGPDRQPGFFKDSEGSSSRTGSSQPTFSALLDDSDASEESTEMYQAHQASAAISHANTPIPTTSGAPGRAVVTLSAGRTGSNEEETTTSTITTTTIITTMPSPGERLCFLLTAYVSLWSLCCFVLICENLCKSKCRLTSPFWNDDQIFHHISFTNFTVLKGG